MNIFKRLFCKKLKPQIPSMPPWDDIVKTMHDKQLDVFEDTVVRVIYSKDKSARFIVFKSEKKLFYYSLEEIQKYSDDEWNYIYSNGYNKYEYYALPAMWSPKDGFISTSLFANETELMNELKSESAYKQHFE